MKILLMIGAVGVLALGTGPGIDSARLSEVLLTPPDCTKCTEGYSECGGQVFRHSFGWSSSGLWLDVGSWDDCVAGSCKADFHEDDCMAEEDDTEELAALFAASEVLNDPQLRHLLDVNEGVLAYNAVRHSLQLIGCNDALLANAPLPPARTVLVDLSP